MLTGEPEDVARDGLRDRQEIRQSASSSDGAPNVPANAPDVPAEATDVGATTNDGSMATPNPPPGSNVNPGSWAQFQHRMQLRRETTCLVAMRRAMETGDYATALQRANELVALDASWNEVKLLIEQLQADALAAAHARPDAQPQPIARRAAQPDVRKEARGGKNRPDVDLAPSGGKNRPAADLTPSRGKNRPAADLTPSRGKNRPVADLTPRGGKNRPVADLTPKGAGIGVAAPVRPRRRRLRASLVTAMVLVAAAVVGWVIGDMLPSDRIAALLAPLIDGRTALQEATPPDSAPPPSAAPQATEPQPAEPQAAVPPPVAPLGAPTVSQPPAAPPASQVSPDAPTTRPPSEHAPPAASPPVIADPGRENRSPQTRSEAPTRPSSPTVDRSATGNADSGLVARGTAGNTAATGAQAVSATSPDATRPPPSVSTSPERLPAPVGPMPPPSSTSASNSGSQPARDARVPPADSGAALAATIAQQEREEQERAIGATLGAYAQGYNSLSAAAVKRIWPTVNDEALADAFEQLESQRIAFTSCSVNIRGLHASATCRGMATYVPRVGNRERTTMSHEWQFSLRRVVNTWVIDGATIR